MHSLTLTALPCLWQSRVEMKTLAAPAIYGPRRNYADAKERTYLFMLPSIAVSSTFGSVVNKQVQPRRPAKASPRRESTNHALHHSLLVNPASGIASFALSLSLLASSSIAIAPSLLVATVTNGLSIRNITKEMLRVPPHYMAPCTG